eukprot:Rhum_TRINITY_DN25429_c0_g1::Rhum_TRINITY_DN25429_c0_g1_i1::g.182125::m.182125
MGEFRGAVVHHGESISVPDNVTDVKDAYPYIEMANTMVGEMGRTAMIRCGAGTDTVYVRVELRTVVLVWSWPLFAQKLRLLGRMNADMKSCKQRGVPYKEPSSSSAENFFCRRADDVVGYAHGTVKRLTEQEEASLSLGDMYYNCIGYVTVRCRLLECDGDPTARIELVHSSVMTRPCWVVLRAGGDHDETHRLRVPHSCNAGDPSDCDSSSEHDDPTVAFVALKDAESTMIVLEVWRTEGVVSSTRFFPTQPAEKTLADPLAPPGAPVPGGGSHGRESSGGLRKNPLLGGGYSADAGSREGSSQRKERRDRKACVVCHRVGRKGEDRKSGYKCSECIGIPSSSKSAKAGTPHMNPIVRDMCVASQIHVVSLPGGAS